MDHDRGVWRPLSRHAVSEESHPESHAQHRLDYRVVAVRLCIRDLGLSQVKEPAAAKGKTRDPRR